MKKKYIYCRKCKFTIYDLRSVEQNICFYCKQKLDDNLDIKDPKNESKSTQGTLF